jgi:hypothetical protein
MRSSVFFMKKKKGADRLTARPSPQSHIHALRRVLRPHRSLGASSDTLSLGSQPKLAVHKVLVIEPLGEG